MTIDQFAIPILGVASVWLSQDKRYRVARWACICGLCAQPFWIYATYKAGQWGILASAALYTWSWFKGFRIYWLKR